MRRFAGLDAGTDTLPDETTTLNFRYLLQTHRLSARLFAEVRGLLAEKGLLLKEGTTVDATLIAAPPSTKNRDGSADRGYDYPQIHAQLEENLIEDWVARKAKQGKPLDAWTRNLNRAIAGLRAIGEHPFRILKRQFDYTKVRYRGLEKNTAGLLPWSGSR